MTTVSFVTFCHPPHLERLHKEGVLLDIIKSHAHPFQEIIIVHQRCRGIPYRPITEVPGVRIVESEDYYPQIFGEYGIQWPDPVADEWTHGPGGAHFWENHVQNHLIGLACATSEYIVFADCDTKIIHSGRRSWVEAGMDLLKTQKPLVFCISPNDGSPARSTQTMSQQCFLAEAERMRTGPLGLPWDGHFVQGGPMAEYYFMLEGRIGRLLITKGWYRYVLPPLWRFWHYNPWEV